jgi:hypothetical protein
MVTVGYLQQMVGQFWLSLWAGMVFMLLNGWKKWKEKYLKKREKNVEFNFYVREQFHWSTVLLLLYISSWLPLCYDDLLNPSDWHPSSYRGSLLTIAAFPRWLQISSIFPLDGRKGPKLIGRSKGKPKNLLPTQEIYISIKSSPEASPFNSTKHFFSV